LVISALIDSKDPDAIPMLVFLVGLGIVTFLIGLGLILNGLLFTRPRAALKDSSAEAQAQHLADSGSAPQQLRAAADNPELFRSPTTSDLLRNELPIGSSVTEHTTHHLKKDR